MSKLLIVESPTKVKSIKKYLGSDYTVMASQGHIRDLPKSKFGTSLFVINASFNVFQLKI